MSKVTRTAKAVERAYARFEVKAMRDDERVIEGIATTPAADRVGDIVEPLGAKFNLPLPLLWQHDHGQPIGHVEFGEATKSGIKFRARLVKVDEPGRLKDRLDEAWQSIKSGLVRAVSIGFRSLEYSVMDDGGWRFLEWEWLELSAVTIPANAEASISRIKSIDRELRAASGTSPRVDGSKPARVGASRKERSVKGDSPMTTISERISALEAEETNLKAQIKKFDVENLDDADEEAFEELKSDLKSTRKTLDNLRFKEALDADVSAVVVDVKDGESGAASRAKYQHTTVKGPNSNIPKGIAFARSVLCKAVSRLHGGDPVTYAEKMYPDDPRIAQVLQKAAIPAAVTTASGWASEWAEAQAVGSEFIEVLRPMSILGRMSGVSRAPFNTEVLAMTAGTTGSWTQEAYHGPMSKGTSAKITLGKTKVTAITALTKESARFGNVDIEAKLLRDLTRATASRIDQTLVSTSAAVANTSPAGLLNGLTAISANGSGAAADIRADLQDLFAPFTAANISRKGMVLVMHENLHLALMLTHDNGFRAFPDVNAEGGSILGIPVIASNHVAAGDVIMISQEDIYVAEDADVEVSTTDQASLEMLDSSLEGEGATPTGVTTAGVVNLWQAGLIGIKTERFVNWQKARAAAVAYIGDAGWNGVASS